MVVSSVVAASIAVQLLAGVLALRLVRTTGARLAWALVAAGLWGMAGRRAVSLFAAFSGALHLPSELAFELLGLATSCCMLVGVYGIGPLFEESRRAREQSERHATELEAIAASLQVAIANAKVLRGLLPICAGCKKIRDDQGYWHQVEAYLHAHTEADFSHGICPECTDRLYPGYREKAGEVSG